MSFPPAAGTMQKWNVQGAVEGRANWPCARNFFWRWFAFAVAPTCECWQTCTSWIQELWAEFCTPWSIFCTCAWGRSPSGQRVPKLPDVFQDLYSTTFAVIDATEIKVEVASSLPAQSQLYSSYKSHTTLKGLVAMTPDGSVCFVSELFGGSISDQELVIRSHLLDLMPSVGYGASIMADKGFDIQDLLVPYGVKLNIPPFKQAGVQMSLQDVQLTQLWRSAYTLSDSSSASKSSTSSARSYPSPCSRLWIRCGRFAVFWLYFSYLCLPSQSLLEKLTLLSELFTFACRTKVFLRTDFFWVRLLLLSWPPPFHRSLSPHCL